MAQQTEVKSEFKKRLEEQGWRSLGVYGWDDLLHPSVCGQPPQPQQCLVEKIAEHGHENLRIEPVFDAVTEERFLYALEIYVRSPAIETKIEGQ